METLQSVLTMTLSHNPTDAGNQQGRETSRNPIHGDPYEVRHLVVTQGVGLSRRQYEDLVQRRHDAQQLADFMEGR